MRERFAISPSSVKMDSGIYPKGIYPKWVRNISFGMTREQAVELAVKILVVCTTTNAKGLVKVSGYNRDGRKPRITVIRDLK